MQISIGANIRKLRLSRNMTQEQLAEAFGVSPQAVSRWENDSACPDVTLLPGVAIFFDTTVDEILGMDALRSEESLRGVHTQVNTLVESGDIAGAVALIRENLRIYPNNAGLLMTLGETLAHDSADPAAAGEAVRIAERVLRSTDISMKARATTTVNLMYLYLRTGNGEGARQLIKTLPHIWESREMLAPEALDGAEYEAALKDAVKKALVYLCQRIDAAGGREYGKTPGHIQLGVDFTPTMPVEKMLEKIGGFVG